MDKETKVENLMGVSIDKIKQMVDVSTVVGDPIPLSGGTTLIPVSKVSYGFASGGSDLPTKGEKDLFIITNFNKMYIAFRVHTVVGISRISWRDIQKPDNTVSGGADGVATGIAQCGKDLVTILDFEKIVAEIAPETGIQLSEVDAMGKREKRSEPVWVAEDSILLSQMIRTALTKAGYTNLRMFQNGAELWEALQACKDGGGPTGQVSIVITDLEMPQMDGHNLTKRIKEDKELQAIPVIIFSSLITEEMRRKGKEVGADEQLSKPEIGHLIGIVDHLLERSRRKREAGQA